MAARAVYCQCCLVRLIADIGHACVERLQFVAGDFGIVHALEEGTDAGIIFAPEVVCDCKYVSKIQRL
jgi:hypothetical protein